VSGRERIRLTFYSDAEYFGGAEGYLVLLARHLDLRDFDLSAVLPAAGAILEQKLAPVPVAVHHLPRPGFRWMPKLPEMIRTFRRLAGDVLHLNLPSAYDAGVSSVAWAARQAGYRRVVSTEHLPMHGRKYRKFPAKCLFSHWIDSVVTVAEANRIYLTRDHGIPGEKVRVIPNGVEDTAPYTSEERGRLRASWGVRGDELAVGIVGRLTRRKGHHHLLSALARMPDSPPFRLIVVGDGEEEATLQEQARSLGLAGRIVWLGACADAPRLMRAFDLFTLPSSVEAMPLTILEAMAAGLPVVATAVFGVPEVVVEGQTGLLVPPENEEILGAALGRLLGAQELRREMGGRARRRYEERFTAEKMAQATAAVYRGEEAPAGSLHAA